jgi:hypothetical protein
MVKRKVIKKIVKLVLFLGFFFLIFSKCQEDFPPFPFADPQEPDLDKIVIPFCFDKGATIPCFY